MLCTPRYLVIFPPFVLILTVPFLCVYYRQQNLLGPSKVQCKNNELEPSTSSPASSSSSESSSTQWTRMQRAGRAKRDLSTSVKTGSRKGTMDQDEAHPESPTVLLERIIQESEEEEDDNSLNEVKEITLGFTFLIHPSEFRHKHHELSQ